MRRLRSWLNDHAGLTLALLAAVLLGGLVAPHQDALAQYFAQVFALDGSISAPSYTFNNNTNRGFFNNTGDSAIGVAVGGADAGALAQTYWRTPGQIRSRQNTAPTVNAGTMITGSTDQMWRFNPTTTTSYVLTFATTMTGITPSCWATVIPSNGTPGTTKNPVSARGYPTGVEITTNGSTVPTDIVQGGCIG